MGTRLGLLSCQFSPQLLGGFTGSFLPWCSLVCQGQGLRLPDSLLETGNAPGQATQRLAPSRSSPCLSLRVSVLPRSGRFQLTLDFYSASRSSSALHG